MSMTLRNCVACDAAYAPGVAGWWGTATALVCPRCVRVLTTEDHEELGPTFQPLERSSS